MTSASSVLILKLFQASLVFILHPELHSYGLCFCFEYNLKFQQLPCCLHWEQLEFPSIPMAKFFAFI